MAGSMNWTGMEALIEAVKTTKTNWISAAEEVKNDTTQKLRDSYAGHAAETTEEKMDAEIKKASNYFDSVAEDLSKILAEQKAAWEEQERKATNSVQ